MWLPDDRMLRSPKYLAIADALEADIASGVVTAGDQLPPQRELADLLSINLSTVSRAYREAERRGLVSGIVGKGTFISTDVSTSVEMLSTEKQHTDQIEMGTVVPLSTCDPDLEPRMSKVIQGQNLATYTQYTKPAGLDTHLEIGAQWAKRFGMSVSADNVLVTAGAQHALTCVFMACCKVGSRVAVDCLTYPGLKALASMMDIRLVPISMDEKGMIPDALNSACKSTPIDGIYLMPGCHNPTGITMEDTRRGEIVTLIKKHQLLLIEDDAYYFTSAKPKPALSSCLPDRSILIAGFSKILFSGLRTAFVVAPPSIRQELVRAVLNSIWMAPSLHAEIICHSIVDGTIDNVITAKLQEARVRNKLVCSMLPFQTPAKPSGAFFMWYQLPDGWTAPFFEACARQKGVNVFCGEKFAVGNQSVGRYIRLAITSPDSRLELIKGTAMLKDLLHTSALGFEGIN